MASHLCPHEPAFVEGLSMDEIWVAFCLAGLILVGILFEGLVSVSSDLLGASG